MDRHIARGWSAAQDALDNTKETRKVLYDNAITAATTTATVVGYCAVTTWRALNWAYYEAIPYAALSPSAREVVDRTRASRD